MSDTELNALWLELERRCMQREQSASEQIAEAWADLIAAFGEADVAGATGGASVRDEQLGAGRDAFDG